MRKPSQQFWMYSAILACALFGFGSAYVLQTMGDDQLEENAQAPEAKPENDSDFVIGPGHMPSPPMQKRDAEPKSQFALDQNGALLINENTETVLEHFLAMLPSDATEAQLKNIEAKVRAGLPQDAAAKAASLMRAYIDYRQAQNQLAQEPEPQNLTDERRAADKTIALRRKYFDRDIADAIFGVRETQQIYSLEVARIASDNTLSAESKAQQIKSLHAALPRNIAALEFNRSDDFSPELEERVAELRRRGAANEEIRHLRYHYFGMEVPEADQALENKKGS